MNPLQRALIEKIGHDHGFEHVVNSTPDGVVLASARHAAIAQVLQQPANCYLLILQAATPALLPEMQRTFSITGKGDSFTAADEAELAALLSRAASLARALPNQAVHDFETAVSCQLATIPIGFGNTEIERLVRQRVGQQKFRDAMLDYWGGACAVTGVALPEVLRASHTKPWAECSSDSERLDVFNGFLLVANLDALFDRFLITFDKTGLLVAANRLSADSQSRLGLKQGMTLRWLSDAHSRYLAWHREKWDAENTIGIRR